MKRRNIILLVSIVIIAAFATHLTKSFHRLFTESMPCEEDFMFGDSLRYSWLFDSTKISNLKCEYALGNPNEGKYHFLYLYKNLYRYWIIEDAKLNNVQISKITDSITNINSSQTYINPSDVNDMYWGGHIYFSSKPCIDSSNSLLINFSSNSKVVSHSTSNEKHISGLFQTFLLQNENKKNLYFLSYDGLKKTDLIFYKRNGILYLIVINTCDGNKLKGDGTENLNLN